MANRSASRIARTQGDNFPGSSNALDDLRAKRFFEESSLRTRKIAVSSSLQYVQNVGDFTRL
jgi:hypothetical protein